MIYPDSFEQKLGFDQIRMKLKGYCHSPAGEEWVDRMRFSSDPDFIRTILKQGLEFRQILEKGDAFPSKHFSDPSPWLQKIAVEGDWLEALDFLALAYSLETILSCRAILQKDAALYPELFKLTLPVTVTDAVARRVLATIDEKGAVRDTASPELSRVRKRLRDEQGRLRKMADEIFRKAVGERWVPEGALPTIREGRVVIPIQAEHKRKLKGFILDESATGQTVFLEPTEMLDANNEIRDLEHAEKREVIRILRELTNKVRDELPLLEIAFRFLAQLDFIRAKARLALEINGDYPIIENQPELEWYQAKHPLLFLSLKKDKRDIVPLTVSLDRKERMLLVSGPNAGGKSVCLKTVGLLQYMAQCGLLVPLSERSHVGVFKDIFLDIGDQQSIENDLSTYSSHLHNMRIFIESASSASLILLDELGSGTDPNFGGAIAQSVLDTLLQREVWGLATTHYYNLKLFADQHGGIRNAAMRFDDKNLVPLYVLDIGKPGSSFALEIARSTGLPQETITNAEKLVGKELAGFESLVRSLERERQELMEKVSVLEQQDAALKTSLEKYQRLSADLEARKKEIISRAKEDAANLLKQTNREIEKTIRHIKENKAEKKETQKVRKNLETLTHKVAEGPKKEGAPVGPLKEGDRVRIIGHEGNGVILAIQGNTATIQFGLLKSVTKLNKLEKITAPLQKEVEAKLRTAGLDVQEKRLSFSSTLDIRGKRVDEVISILDKFMDTAILLGHGELKILHGKGEGVLRKVVRDHLKLFREVASLKDEHVEQGGDGITVVVLK